MSPHIIFEDDFLIVINKPSGTIVNRADTTRGEVTVQDWVEEIYPKHAPSGLVEKTENGEYNKEYEFYNRSGIVHRLDKETSGILLIAKTVEAFAKLQNQFKERTVKKVYLALAHGRVVPEQGEIHAPIGRLEWNRKRFGVISGGREAVTKYIVKEIKFLSQERYPEPLSFLELYPETGRTHQIRVHLKYIQHPIFSDILYTGRKTVRQDRKFLSRLFLHASQVSFSHPVSGKRINCTAPLTDELKNFYHTLN